MVYCQVNGIGSSRNKYKNESPEIKGEWKRFDVLAF
jgi:hypothetical protein